MYWPHGAGLAGPRLRFFPLHVSGSGGDDAPLQKNNGGRRHAAKGVTITCMQLPITSALFLLLAPGARAWAVDGGDVLSGSGSRRWSMGNASSPVEGLRGGIAWALDPNLCESLLPRFPEETNLHGGMMAMPKLVGCNDIIDTIRTSMSAWASANSNVRFFDVTSLCENSWETIEPSAASSLDPAEGAISGCDAKSISCIRVMP